MIILLGIKIIEHSSDPLLRIAGSSGVCVIVSFGVDGLAEVETVKRGSERIRGALEDALSLHQPLLNTSLR